MWLLEEGKLASPYWPFRLVPGCQRGASRLANARLGPAQRTPLWGKSARVGTLVLSRNLGRDFARRRTRRVCRAWRIPEHLWCSKSVPRSYGQRWACYGCQDRRRRRIHAHAPDYWPGWTAACTGVGCAVRLRRGGRKGPSGTLALLSLSKGLPQPGVSGPWQRRGGAGTINGGLQAASKPLRAHVDATPPPSDCATSASLPQ